MNHKTKGSNYITKQQGQKKLKPATDPAILDMYIDTGKNTHNYLAL